MILERKNLYLLKTVQSFALLIGICVRIESDDTSGQIIFHKKWFVIFFVVKMSILTVSSGLYAIKSRHEILTSCLLAILLFLALSSSIFSLICFYINSRKINRIFETIQEFGDKSKFFFYLSSSQGKFMKIFCFSF